MRFDLDKILTDEILFYMENQDGEFLLDTREAKVIKVDADFKQGADFTSGAPCGDDAGSRYIALPEWDSNDGFRLMEKFAVELKNPVIRHELSAALNCKRGVFRSFKNVLEQYGEAEKMWYNYKKSKMKEEVFAWYNALREEWGMEPVGAEPSEISEDISAIVQEDFIFREGKEGDAENVKALHKICMDENENTRFSAGIFPGAQGPNDFPADSIIAETASGDFCGYILAVKNGPHFQITRLEVMPEYRGMGIGKTLLAKLLAKLLSKFTEKTAGKSVVFDLPAGFEYFSRTLHIEGFKPVMQRFTTRGE